MSEAKPYQSPVEKPRRRLPRERVPLWVWLVATAVSGLVSMVLMMFYIGYGNVLSLVIGFFPGVGAASLILYACSLSMR